MCSRQDVGKGFKIPEIQDGVQLEGEALDSILKALGEMGDKLRSNFQETASGIKAIERKVDKGDDRFREVVGDIFTRFSKFENEIRRKIGKADEIKERVRCFDRPSPCIADDTVDRQDLRDLCELDKKRAQKPTNFQLLNAIKEKTKLLERMLDVEFSQVLEAIQDIKRAQQYNKKEENEIKEAYQERFHEHEEFIRTNLLISE